MLATPAVLDSLAKLLAYPTPELTHDASDAEAVLAREDPEAASELVPFVEFCSSHGLGECEELYVTTFDGNAERALEVGWQVFGEQYARGAFLVRMRELMRACGVAETSELPDHLTHVLRVLPRIDAAAARTLVESAVEPALRRILKDLEGRENPYAGVLRAVAAAVGAEVAGAAPPPVAGGAR